MIAEKRIHRLDVAEPDVRRGLYCRYSFVWVLLKELAEEVNSFLNSRIPLELIFDQEGPSKVTYSLIILSPIESG
jgi:hypothetical protein